VIKAADLMGFKVYAASSPEVAEAAKKLPVGRLYASGRGFVPNIRQSLYSDLVVGDGETMLLHWSVGALMPRLRYPFARR
jgi:hypothetical protein